MFAFLRSSSFFAPSSFRQAPRLQLASFDMLFLSVAVAIIMLLSASLTLEVLVYRI